MWCVMLQALAGEVSHWLVWYGVMNVMLQALAGEVLHWLMRCGVMNVNWLVRCCGVMSIFMGIYLHVHQ